jgi:hypothetical protein
MENQVIAQTILKQMGGARRIAAMTGAGKGARRFLVIENGVQFGFGFNNQMNRVMIRLNGSDLYDVEFWKIGKKTCKKVKEYKDVYCDMLIEIFESTTGLYLSL